MRSIFLRQVWAGVRVLIAFTVLLGIAYPLAVWTVSRIPGLHASAEGSMVTVDGRIVGSSLIGVNPVAKDADHDPYFHTRPSAQAADYADGLGLGSTDPSSSSASNLSAGSDKLLQQVAQRRDAIARREGVTPAQVPPDAVTASGSGLDPDISPAYADLQVRRVARENGLSVQQVQQIVNKHVRGRALGVLGDPAVSVLELNLAVEAARR